METICYFVEIEKRSGQYVGHIHQGTSSSTSFLKNLRLQPDTEVRIRETSYKLGDLVRALVDYRSEDLLIAYDEHGQLKLGQHLYTQIFGNMGKEERKRIQNARVEVRIITQDEHIRRLPWVLLADDEGVFLSMADWAVSLSCIPEYNDCELPPSPRILVVAPQPANWPKTQAETHIENLQDLLSGANCSFTLNQGLHTAFTWEEFRDKINNFKPHIIYYYGHGVGDFNTSRLIFATDKKQESLEKPIADLASFLRNAPGDPPCLIYLNCCHGDAGGLLGAGQQLSFIPAVVTNRTLTYIDTAQNQALDFWRSVLIDGMPPHIAIAKMYSRLIDLDLSVGNPRWMTPVVHCQYSSWRSNHLPGARNNLERDPHWRHKLDRVRQFAQVFYQTGEMLRNRTHRSLAYVWYGREGEGVGLFHQRLTVELRANLADLYLYTVNPEWPKHLENIDKSFEYMLSEAFEVDSLHHIPGRIRTQNQGLSGRQTLVYVCHEPIQSSKIITPKILRTYVEWWDCNFIPLLKEKIFALLGISFIVGEPNTFIRSLRKSDHMGTIELRSTRFRILDEMERLVKDDLLQFIQDYDIRLPHSRRERILERILDKTHGHYEMSLEELKELASRAWDTEEGEWNKQALGDEKYGY